jgi:membrane fusion protein (multidrug efflux system)
MKLPNQPQILRLCLLSVLSASLLLSGCKGGGDAAEGDEAKEEASADAGKDGKDGKKEEKSEAVPVEVSAVARRTISASYAGTATLEAPGEAQVVAKTSGVLMQLLAEEGDVVKKGQVLARIDHERTRLEMERSRATVNKLQNNYRRAQELQAQKLVSAEAADQIRYDLESAKASLDLAQLELSYTNIVAPFDGVIAQRMAKRGNLIALNAPVFRIVDNSQLEAPINVPEREMSTLRSGLPLRMTVDAVPGKVFEGRVDRVSPVVDAGSGTFRVVAAFSGNSELRPGMFGRIEVVYEQREGALTLPRNALLEENGESAVYVVRGKKAVRVPVQLGYINGEVAEIRAGVKEGEQVITAGKVAVRDGSEVEVIGQPKPKIEADKPEASTAVVSE